MALSGFRREKEQVQVQIEQRQTFDVLYPTSRASAPLRQPFINNDSLAMLVRSLVHFFHEDE